MAKWVSWITYIVWGALCFLLFFYFFFPYEALGRRVLYTFEKRTHLVTRPSRTNARFFGIHWARVEISHPRQKAFPPFEIQNWVIKIRPLPLLVARLSAISDGTLLGGTFHANVVIQRRGQRGSAEWDSIRIDGFRLSSAEGGLLGGILKGRIGWAQVDNVIEGEAEFSVDDGSVTGMRVVGVTLPPLDLGEIRGQITWEGERVDLREISVAGEDLEGKLTGNIFYQDPVTKSKLAGRLELAFTRKLVDRYPAIAGLSTRGQGKPLIFSIRGILENPRFSLTR